MYSPRNDVICAYDTTVGIELIDSVYWYVGELLRVGHVVITACYSQLFHYESHHQIRRQHVFVTLA
ncbi:hypothetical protein IFVP182_P30018 [Vibrio parahaemolyticus]